MHCCVRHRQSFVWRMDDGRTCSGICIHAGRHLWCRIWRLSYCPRRLTGGGTAGDWVIGRRVEDGAAKGSIVDRIVANHSQSPFTQPAGK